MSERASDDMSDVAEPEVPAAELRDLRHIIVRAALMTCRKERRFARKVLKLNTRLSRVISKYELDAVLRYTVSQPEVRNLVHP
jgi:hypothetical protein